MGSGKKPREGSFTLESQGILGGSSASVLRVLGRKQHVCVILLVDSVCRPSPGRGKHFFFIKLKSVFHPPPLQSSLLGLYSAVLLEEGGAHASACHVLVEDHTHVVQEMLIGHLLIKYK